jgi:hypothetical protein
MGLVRGGISAGRRGGRSVNNKSRGKAWQRMTANDDDRIVVLCMAHRNSLLRHCGVNLTSPFHGPNHSRFTSHGFPNISSGLEFANGFRNRFSSRLSPPFARISPTFGATNTFETIFNPLMNSHHQSFEYTSTISRSPASQVAIWR